MKLFSVPGWKVQPYDPLPPSHGQITINVENQRQERDNLVLGTIETQRTGRVRIVIEGEGEYVAPYLDAVTRITHERNHP